LRKLVSIIMAFVMITFSFPAYVFADSNTSSATDNIDSSSESSAETLNNNEESAVDSDSQQKTTDFTAEDKLYVTSAEITDYDQLINRYDSYSAFDGLYFNQLSDNEKTIYNSVISADPDNLMLDIKLPDSYVITPSFDNGSYVYQSSDTAQSRILVLEAMDALLKDHPDMDWFDIQNTSVTVKFNLQSDNTYSADEIVIELSPSFTSETLTDYKKSISNIIISGDDTYSKVLSIHDYICNNYSYSSEDTSSTTVFEALGNTNIAANNKAYSELFKLLCDDAGIPCIIVASSDYIWNAVEMDDGCWYSVDVPEDDSGVSVVYDNLLVGSNTADQYMAGQEYLEEHIGFTSINGFVCKSYMLPVISSTKYINSDVTGTLSASSKILLLQSYTVENYDVEPSIQSTSPVDITINWSSATSGGYEIYCSTNGIEFKQISTITDTSITTYDCTGLKPESIYYFKVKVYTGTGSSKQYQYESNIIAGITDTINKVYTSAVSSSATCNIVNWTKSKCDGYVIYISMDGVNYSEAGRAEGSNTLSYISSKLIPNTGYFYKVKPYSVSADNTVYYGLESNIASSTTKVLSVPSALTKSSSTSTSISFTWNSTVSSDGYEAYISSDNVNYTLAADFTSGDTASGTITGLVPNKSFYIKLRAYTVTSSGQRCYSKYTDVINAATGTVAVPSVSEDSVTFDSATVKWTAVNCSGYELYISADGVSYSLAKTINESNTLTCTLADLLPNTKYYIKVCAYVTISDTVYESLSSNIINLTTEQIEAPVLTKGSVSLTSAGVIWTKIDCDGYGVYISTDGNNFTLKEEITGNSTVSYIASNLSPNTAYYIKVAGYKVGSDSKHYYGTDSNVITETTSQLAECSLSASLSGDQVLLGWTKSNGDGYIIYRAVAGGNYTVESKIESAFTLSYTDSGLSSETTYSYKITPYVNSGETTYTGVLSDAVTVTTPSSDTINEPYYVNADDVNFRSGPGTTYSSYGTLSQGTNVTVINKSNSEWYKVKNSYNVTGYIYSLYLTAGTYSEPTTTVNYVKVTADGGLNMRESASASATILTCLDNGTILILEDSSDSSWYKVKTVDGKYEGYCYSAYLVKYDASQSATITLSESSASFEKYKTLYLAASYSGLGGTLTWKTSNASVATVSDGFVYGVTPGTASITAYDSNGTANAVCNITVTESEAVRFVYSDSNCPYANSNFDLIALTDDGKVAVKFVIDNATTLYASSYTDEGALGGVVRTWRCTTSLPAGTYSVSAYSDSGSGFSATGKSFTLIVTSSTSNTDTTYDTRAASTEMINLIAGYEGLLTTATPDTLAYGNPITVGYGYVVYKNTTFYNGMSQSEAYALLADKVNSTFSSSINSYRSKYGLKMSQCEFDALVSFTYNLGSGWQSSTYFSSVIQNAIDYSALNISESNTYQAYIDACDTADIRTGPSDTYSTSGTVAIGTSVTIDNVAQGANQSLWYHMAGSGWVRGGYIRFVTSNVVHDLKYADAYGLAYNSLQYCYAGGVKLPGLYYRRLAETKVFLYGNYDEASSSNSNYKVNTYGFIIP
jgi:uncharacterized protein YgiM (DUF1202 family)